MCESHYIDSQNSKAQYVESTGQELLLITFQVIQRLVKCQEQEQGSK